MYQDGRQRHSRSNKRVCLVSCSGPKQSTSTSASELYTSPLFKASRYFAEHQCDEWFIISAKHGLVKPSDILAPYDLEMKSLSKSKRKEWAHNVVRTLVEIVKPTGTCITLLAGQLYTDYLCKLLEDSGYTTSCILGNLSFGKRLQWLNHVNNDLMINLGCLDDFYYLLNKLYERDSMFIPFRQLSASQFAEKKGVYFIVDPLERRSSWPSYQRVVRIGTHAVSKGSRATLWNRLRTHLGTDDGGGNHRSSVFRLHVGNAILSSLKRGQDCLSWGKGQSYDQATREGEQWLEKLVSEYIGGLLVCYINVCDDSGPSSDRSYIERNAVALLSHSIFIDKLSDKWLGHSSPHSAIQTSGLWNVDYTNSVYDPIFLDTFSYYIDVAIGLKSMPLQSIAPSNWHDLTKRKSHPSQLDILDVMNNAETH